MYNVINITLLSIVCCCLLQHKVYADNNETNLIDAAKSDCFIDKTLFIKDFIDERPDNFSIKLITAPPKSGKSTIIDMVARFLSVQINNDGTVASYENNTNYDIFCEKPLKICQDEKFMKKHFGRYPVIRINFRPLRKVKDLETCAKSMQDILRQTFLEHEYLLNDNFTWNLTMSRQDVRQFIAKEKTETSDLYHNCLALVEVLHHCLKRKAIVLIDDYGAHYASLLFSNVTDADRIIDFLNAITDALLKYDEHFQKTLLTGVFRIEDVLIGARFRYYKFLGNHTYSKYFALTEEEVTNLVTKKIESTERHRVLKNLKDYYGGYLSPTQPDANLYSRYSVTNFFLAGKRLANYSHHQRPYTENLLQIVPIDEIRHTIKELLFGNGYIRANISDQLSIKDKRGYRLKADSELPLEREATVCFHSYLYDLGYVSANGKIQSDSHGTGFRIPNRESYVGLSKILLQAYESHFKFSRSSLENFQKAVSSFKAHDTESYRKFYESLQTLIIHRSDVPVEDDIESLMFVSLLDVYPTATKRIAEFYANITVSDDILNEAPSLLGDRITKFKEEDIMKEMKKRIDMVVINEHRIIIVIEVKLKKNNCSVSNSLGNLAIDALAEIYFTYHDYLLTKAVFNLENDPVGMLYIGIAFDGQSRNTAIGFSFRPYRITKENYPKDQIFMYPP